MPFELNPIFKGYCENTTLHGWAYIPAVNRLVYRLFWFAVIISMFIGGAIIVTNANSNWISSPTISSVESFAEPVQTVQFPTITICPVNGEPDKWGFMRSVLNSFKLYCSNAEECEETVTLRSKFPKTLSFIGHNPIAICPSPSLPPLSRPLLHSITAAAPWPHPSQPCRRRCSSCCRR